MKVFLVIFSMYIMALSLMPCTDMDIKPASGPEFSMTNHAHEANHDHSATEDSCTPFCTCSCCGATYVPAMYWTSFSFSLKDTFDYEKSQPRYISLFVPNYLDSIWQPPKLIV